MMEGYGPLGGLLTVCTLMFGGAWICGALPYFVTIREAQLQSVSALGGGLMIGSALAVIIPEGFHSFAEVRW
jgi:zinc transporter 9